MGREAARAQMTPDEWLTRMWLRGDDPARQEDSAAGRDTATARVESTGGVIGNVVDARGRPVTARVLLRRGDGGAVRECSPLAGSAEGAAGWFELCGLPAGAYVLSVEAPGFQAERRSGIRVEPYGITAIGSIRLRPLPSRRRGFRPRLPAIGPLRSRTAPEGREGTAPRLVCR